MQLRSQNRLQMLLGTFLAPKCGQLGSKNCFQMLLGALSAPKRGQVGSKTLTLTRGTPTLGSLFAKKLCFKAAKGVQLGPQMAPKTGF